MIKFNHLKNINQFIKFNFDKFIENKKKLVKITFLNLLKFKKLIGNNFIRSKEIQEMNRQASIN